jgi:hypothetical protein
MIMAAQVLVCSAMASLEIEAVKELLEGVFSSKRTEMNFKNLASTSQSSQ